MNSLPKDAKFIMHLTVDYKELLRKYKGKRKSIHNLSLCSSLDNHFDLWIA